MKQQTNTIQSPSISQEAVSAGVGQDLRTAILIVSVVLNLVVFVTWLTLQVTTRYDASLASYLLQR